MPKLLRLEYACTPAEREEAQSLNLRRQLGGGSRWRTWLILLLVLIGMLLAFYQQVIRELPVAYRPFAVGGLVLLFFVVVWWQRRSRNAETDTTRVEISETEMAIVGPESRVAMLWSAFSDCLESPNLFVLLDRPKGVLVILPKRAFPDADSQAWFRVQANVPRSRVEPRIQSAPHIALAASADQVTLEFRLAYWDYLDRTLASYRTWGIFLAVGVLILGVNLHAAANPPPNPVYSAGQVFFYFVLPFLLVLVMLGVFLISFQAWRSNANYLVPQHLVLSDGGIVFASQDSSGSIPWTTYTRYKETRWSFILWNPRGSLWTMLPKRNFASPDDLERCRTLLARQLVRSRWFFG